MKTFLTLALVVCSTLSFAQSDTFERRVPASAKAIPKVVFETFKEQYPNAKIDSWYVTHITYWQQDISSGWYRDWYGNIRRDVVVMTYEKPNYFEVEFMDVYGSLSRAIYNRYGYWYETRAQLKGLPMACLETLATSKYKDWKRSRLTERIETAEWPDPVYRFSVSKGLRFQILRMSETGEIIQIKYIDED